jgi:hypothetical protein
MKQFARASAVVLVSSATTLPLSSHFPAGRAIDAIATLSLFVTVPACRL